MRSEKKLTSKLRTVEICQIELANELETFVFNVSDFENIKETIRKHGGLRLTAIFHIMYGHQLTKVPVSDFFKSNCGLIILTQNENQFFVRRMPEVRKILKDISITKDKNSTISNILLSVG